MIKLLALLGVFAAVNVGAQAPTEERMLPGGGPVAQGQQRLGFLIREREVAQVRLHRAELDLLEAREVDRFISDFVFSGTIASEYAE